MRYVPGSDTRMRCGMSLAKFNLVASSTDPPFS
jgi:hypothetical protein